MLVPSSLRLGKTHHGGDVVIGSEGYGIGNGPGSARLVLKMSNEIWHSCRVHARSAPQRENATMIRTACSLLMHRRMTALARGEHFQQEHQEGVSNWTTSDTCKGRDSSGSSPAADASQITADTHQIWTSRLSQVNELSHRSKRGKCWSACGDLVVVLCLPKGPKGSNLRHERRSLPCTCIQPSSRLIIIESKSKHHRSRPNSHRRHHCRRPHYQRQRKQQNESYQRLRSPGTSAGSCGLPPPGLCLTGRLRCGTGCLCRRTAGSLWSD